MRSLDQLSRRTTLSALAAAMVWSGGNAHGASDQLYPDIVSVKIRAADAGAFDFDVTVSAVYDTPSRYADGFRVTTAKGEVLGERKLFHDHQGECRAVIRSLATAESLSRFSFPGGRGRRSTDS